MSLGTISIVSPLKADRDHELNVFILSGSALWNPYKVGEQGPSGSIIEDRTGLKKAYAEYLQHLIQADTPHVIQRLDYIGHCVLDGKDIKLVCMPDAVHGEVIKDLIMEMVNGS